MIADVHRLASTYHWSESEILALPLPRRRRYLAALDAERDAALVRELGLGE
jgi:hypothetical protein